MKFFQCVCGEPCTTTARPPSSPLTHSPSSSLTHSPSSPPPAPALSAPSTAPHGPSHTRSPGITTVPSLKARGAATPGGEPAMNSRSRRAAADRPRRILRRGGNKMAAGPAPGGAAANGRWGGGLSRREPRHLAGKLPRRVTLKTSLLMFWGRTALKPDTRRRGGQAARDREALVSVTGGGAPHPVFCD